MTHTRLRLIALVVFAGMLSAMTLAQGPFAFEFRDPDRVVWAIRRVLNAAAAPK